MKRAASLFLVAVCATGNLWGQCPDGTPPPCGARPARLASAPVPNSVAVIYFDNQSRDTSDAYLADGLTEEITSRLGQLGRLVVTSHTTMERYRAAGDRPEPQALARTLRVAHLVNGSVRRSGHRIRVSVELLRPRDGVQVWSDAYDRTDADLLAIEEEVARAVATAIAGRLLPGEQATLAVRPTRNPAAYDHLLRGNFFLAQRTPVTDRRAIAEYQAATSLDSGFALAFGRIGIAYALAVDWGWPFPGLRTDSLVALGTAAADHALQLDSQSTDGWLARALLRSFLYPATFDGVTQALERAIALDPRNAEAHHILGVTLNTMGREEAAAAEFRRALDLDPQRAITWDNLAWVRRYQHRPEETARCADSGLAAAPLAYYLYADRANFRLTAGDVAGAEADAETAVRTSPADYLLYAEPVLAAVEAAKGDTAAARARLDRLIGRMPDPAHLNYLTAYGVALASLRLGDRDRALSALEKVQPPGLRLWFITRDPDFDVIRDTPRFRALVAQNRPPWADR
jgi:TolB-like protein/Tfp pilus assembly protein PilF